MHAGGGSQSDAKGGGGAGAARLLAVLLTEMDGVEEARGVLLVAATNRLHALDAAMLRPGRFDVVQ